MNFENLIDKIINSWKINLNIINILIVWSYVDSDNFNDIDFLITYTGSYNTFIESMSFLWKLYILDDSIRFNYLWKEVSFVFKEEVEFNNYINKIHNWDINERINKEWAIWWYVPEILLYDLVNSKILLNKNNYLLELINKLKDFDNFNSSKIEKLLLNEIKIKLNYFELWLDNISNQICTSDLILSIIRFIYIRNKLYFPWLKKCFLDRSILLLNEDSRNILFMIKSNNIDIRKVCNNLIKWANVK